MADETQVTELIIDASQAVQGAAQFSDAADQIGVASQDAATKTDALGQQVETTTETVVTSARELRKQAQALDAYRSATDQTYSAQKQLGSISTQLQSAEAALTREMQDGAISVEKYQAELASLKSRQGEISDTSAKLQAGQIAVKDAMKVVAGQSDVVTRGWGLNRTGMMEMQAAGVNAFQALASGMSPWRVAQMEGAQVLGALVQGTQGFLQFALNPWVLGIGAATVAMAGLLITAKNLGDTLREDEIALRATGNSTKISTDQIKSFVEQLRAAGIAAGDAQSAVVGALRDVAGASATDLARATKDAANFAAAYTVPINEAEKALVEMGANGYSAIMKLDDAHHFLEPAQRLMIARLTEQGQQAKAVDLAFEALESRTALATNEQSAFAQAIQSVRQGWDDLAVSVSKSDVVINTIHGVGDAFSALAKVMSGDLPGAWDAWVNHVKNDPTFAILQTMLNGWLRLGEWTSGIKNENGMGSPGSAHGPVVATGPAALAANSGSLEAQKWIDEQTLSYERQNAALSASVGVRSAVQAGLEAEHQAMLKGADATQMKTAYSLAYNAAMVKQVTAVNDNIAKMKDELPWHQKITEAYGISTAAGHDAELQLQAHTATLGVGKKAYENYLAALRSTDAELMKSASSQALANEKLKTANDLEALRISQISDPQVKHDEELAAERQQHRNELMEKYANDLVEVNKHMAEFDSQQMIEDQTRYWNEVYSTAKTYSDDIKNYLVDGLTGVGNSGKSMWASMWDAALAGGKRFLINLAATFLENRLILPIVTQIVGSNSSLLGIVSAGGGATGSLGGLGSLLSGGSGGILSTLSSAYNLLSTGGSSLLTGLGSDLIYSSLGQSLGLSSSVVNMSHLATAGGFQMTGAGSLLSSGLGLLGAGGTGFGIGSIISSLGIGNSTGSSIGGALGGAIGSIIPGVGTIIGSVAGSLLGGLFGNSQPSDFFANTGIDLTKGTIGAVEHGRADETSSTNNSASQNLANSFLTVEKQLLALTGGTGPNSAFAKVGSRDGIVVGVGDGATFWNNAGTRKTFANTDAGAQQAIDWMVQQLAKQLKGVTNQDIQTVLNKGGTADQIISNLTLVQSLLTATATAADPLATAVQSVNDSFDALKKQATDLGLSTDLLTKLEAKRQEQLSEATAAYSLSGYQAVQGSLSTITGFLGSQQLSSDSSLSPLAKQAAAAKQYNDLLAAVQGGDLTQTNALTGAASSYLSVARQNYGSTAGFSSVEAYVTQSLAALGQSIASQQSIGDQITKAIQLSTVTNAQKLDEVKASIEKMTTQLRLMMPQIAAAAA